MQGEEDDCTNKGKKKKNTKQDYIRGLMTRETSTLSHVAWDILKPKYDHPSPTVSIRWKSPDARSFTSRKTAWEYATVLSKQEVTIERNLRGVGASGKLLKEFVPTAKTAVEVGKLRFVRDGLWVVGQETMWQADREEELRIQEEELEEAAASKVYTSGLQLYVAEKRHQYREDNGTNLAQADKALRHQWRCLTPKEQDVWENKVQEQFEDSSVEESGSEDENETAVVDASNSDEDGEEENDEASVEYISPYQYFIHQRRHDYRHEQQMKLEADGSGAKTKFTLAQADKELRQQWKEMSEEQQDEWIVKLEKIQEEQEAEESNETKDATGESEKEEKVVISMGETAVDSKPTTIATTNAEEKMITESSSTATTVSDEKNEKDLPKEDPPKQEPSNNIVFEEEKKSDEGDVYSNELKPMVIESIPSDANIPSPPVKASTAGKKGKGKPKGGKSPKTNNSTAKSTKTASKRGKKKSTRHATPKYCLTLEQISKCHEACIEHYETVMRTVKNRDLSRELADGFDVLRERGHGRFDMEIPVFDTPEYAFLNSFDQTPWMPIVKAILGDDVVLIHKGAFMSLPGAEAQVYHQDGVHLTTQTQRPCHAINVFVPLVDLHSRNGPTEFVLGSHVLGHDGYDRDFLETPKPTAGTPVIFDYRLGHRGLGNSSQSCRPIVYCTYARASDGKEFRDSVNFSRKRYHKIGELSQKPLSREERRNKRKRSIESAKETKELEQAAKLSAMEAKAESEKAIENKKENTASTSASKDDDKTASQGESNAKSTEEKTTKTTLEIEPVNVE